MQKSQVTQGLGCGRGGQENKVAWNQAYSGGHWAGLGGSCAGEHPDFSESPDGGEREGDPVPQVLICGFVNLCSASKLTACSQQLSRCGWHPQARSTKLSGSLYVPGSFLGLLQLHLP